MEFYEQTVDEVFDALSSCERGLTDGEAAMRLISCGKNTLDEPKKASLLVKFFKQFSDVMVLVLIAAAIISAVVGVVQRQYEDFIDVGIILFIVIVNAVIGIAQECKAEKAMAALKSMTAPYCRVRRGGELRSVCTSSLVKGDVVLLEAGDIVPADMRLTKSYSLKAETSALTGESAPEEKHIRPIRADAPLAERSNMLYASSTVTYGHGEGVVTATGMNAEIGRIAAMLDDERQGETPLQKKLNRVGRFISVAVLVIAAAVFVMGILSAAGTGSVGADSVIDSFMTAVALAVAAIPESLTAVITIILALGVQRLSKRNAIIKKLPAVEALGSTNVICSDKTGTLTLNKMTVTSLYAGGRFEPDVHSTECDRLLKCMCLCNDTASGEGAALLVGDPTETALVAYAQGVGYSKAQLERDMPRVDEIPFDSERKLMTTVNRENGGDIIYVKGAADVLLARCDRIQTGGSVVAISDGDQRDISAAVKKMGEKALRVLAYAYKERGGCCQGDYESGLIFIGLTGMMDPPRPEVKASVELCRSAGINVVMITGDNMDTAFAIASELGICNNKKQTVTGTELNSMTDNELKARVDKIKVYARVSPEHKVRIVKAWRARGMIVAMTGDGVNDAPSIKCADIGVGMGITGTEVAKNAADMVLADDNFATIVTAVEEGRTIFCNMQKTIQYLFAANISEVLSLFFATIIFAFSSDPYVFLLPIQILWVNLVTDSLPALALGVEPPESGVMEYPPRSAGDGLFAGGVGVNMIYQGILQTIIVLGVFLGCAFTGWGHEAGTTMAFITLCLVQLFHSFNARSLTGSIFNKRFFSNKLLLLSFVLGATLTVALACFPATHNIFALQWLNGMQWLTVILCSASIIPAVEVVKLFLRSRAKKAGKSLD